MGDFVGYLTCFSTVLYACDLLFCIPNFKLRDGSITWAVILSAAFLVCFNSHFLNAAFRYSGWTVGFVAMGIFLASVICIHAIFDISWQVAFFFGSAAYAVENLVFYIKKADQYFTVFSSLGPWTVPVKLVLVALVLVLVYQLLVCRYRGFGETCVSDGFLVWFVLVTVLVTNVLSTWVRAENMQSPTYAIFAYVCNILLLVYQFDVFKRSSLEVERAVTLQMIAGQEKQQLMSKEAVRAINRECHYLKHRMAALRVMDDEGERSQTIDELIRKVTMYDDVVRTGDSALDAVLTEKSFVCRGCGIDFTCIVDAQRIAGMRGTDLYTVFSSALDNAIEAARELPDEENRVITLRVDGQGDLTRILVVNSCVGSVEIVDGLPAETDDDSRLHVGLRSIRMIVERYGGNMVVTSGEGSFSLAILVPSSVRR